MTILSIIYILMGAVILIAVVAFISLFFIKYLNKDSVDFNPLVIARPEGNHNIAMGNEDFLEDIEKYIDNTIKDFAHESKRDRKKHIC